MVRLSQTGPVCATLERAGDAELAGVASNFVSKHSDLVRDRLRRRSQRVRIGITLSNEVRNGNNSIVTNMSTKPSIVCNNTAGALEGISFDGTSTGTQIKGNTMRNAKGLLLKASAVIGEQQYAGNKWQQNSTAVCENANADASK